MAFTAFDILTAEEQNNLVENIEALAAGTGLNAGVITNAKLSTTAGELGGAWVAFTPTISSGSLGNGTLVGRYTRIGKTIHFSILLTCGSTTSFPGGSQFTLPATINTTAYDFGARGGNYFTGGWFDNSASNSFRVFGRMETATAARIVYLSAITGQISGTPPAAIATSDTISLLGTYESV